MLKKNSQNTLAFITIIGASFALYPAAQSENDFLIWTLLALISSAAILTTLRKS